MDYPDIIKYKFPNAEYAYDEDIGIHFWDDVSPVPSFAELDTYATEGAYVSRRALQSRQIDFKQNYSDTDTVDAILADANGRPAALNQIKAAHQASQ